MPRPLSRGLLLLALAVLLAGPAGAVQRKKKDAPPPDTGPALATPWSQGTAAPLTLPGGLTGVWASAGKLDGTKLVLPADSPAGTRWLRAATGAGVSAPRPVSHDPYPEVAEDPKNRSRETPQPLPVPCCVAGKADAEARAFFRIPVTKNKPLTVEVLARRLGSPLDPVVVLFFPDGRTVPGAYADDTPGATGDCRVTWTPPADGAVVAEVRDSTYKGGPDFTYRMRVGNTPGATTAFPLVALRGETVRVGWAGPHADKLPPVTLTAPADPALEAVTVHPPGGWPVTVRLSDHPQATEVEPNETPATANRLPTPGGVSARFAGPNDRDQFRFPVAKGQKYAVTALTHEVHSPAEVLVRVLGPDGAELGQSDPTKPACVVEFVAPADGDCVAACEHQNYLHGPAEVYHLSVRTVRPDFTVSLAGDRLTLPAGGVGLLPAAKLERLNGFAGPVTLSVVGDGLAGSGPADGPVGVTCSADAKPGVVAVRVKAVGTLDGVEAVRWASVAEPVRAALNTIPQVPPELATTVVAGVQPAAPFGLTVAADPAPLPAGGKRPVSVTLTRRAGFAEPVGLTLVNPPAGVTAAAATVAKDATTATLEVSAAGDAAAGVRWLVVKGTAGKAEALALPVAVTVSKK